jgi:hypothetical protein
MLIGFRWGEKTKLSVFFWKCPVYVAKIQKTPFFLFFNFLPEELPDSLTKYDKAVLIREFQKFSLQELNKSRSDA